MPNGTVINAPAKAGRQYALHPHRPAQGWLSGYSLI